MQRKEVEKNALRETSLERNQEIQKANETRGEVNVTKDKSNNGENKEPEKEAALSDQSEKDFASLIQTYSGVDVVKEGEN